MSDLLAVLGGCGGIGRTVVQGARARGYDVAVLDLPASLAAHPPPDDTLSIALDATEDQQVAVSNHQRAATEAGLFPFDLTGFKVRACQSHDTSEIGIAVEAIQMAWLEEYKEAL